MPKIRWNKKSYSPPAMFCSDRVVCDSTRSECNIPHTLKHKRSWDTRRIPAELLMSPTSCPFIAHKLLFQQRVPFFFFYFKTLVRKWCIRNLRSHSIFQPLTTLKLEFKFVPRYKNCLGQLTLQNDASVVPNSSVDVVLYSPMVSSSLVNVLFGKHKLL